MTPPDPSNTLSGEHSPYLLQHSKNPVAWYPWCEEAFDKARELDRPVFLSIGYSTCHWCHVMAHESFEDDGVAQLLNADFVSIKVDREERPDIDHIYMTACQMMTGSGGWPLTIVMTPDGSPFFAATYVPRQARTGRMGMMELLPRLAKLWRSDRPRLLATALQATSALASAMSVREAQGPGVGAIEAAVQQLAVRFDPAYGGFGEQMKFPTPHNVTLLLRHYQRTGAAGSLAMAKKTLDGMWTGGLFDHLGNGFHRYSTDRRWRLPHFEKMLYDQALLASAYLEAAQLTEFVSYRNVAARIFQYVLTVLQAPEGGFYCAEDADSEGEEGRYYVWQWNELSGVLSPAQLALAETCFGLAPEGNFDDPVHPDAAPRNVIYLADPEGDETPALARLRDRLLAIRQTRVRPGLDDKILTDWNGLMIAALAQGGRVLGDPQLTMAARRAVAFVEAHLVDPSGRLRHRFRGTVAGIDGQLDDYAFYALGLLELYQATFDPEHLARAMAVARMMMDLFLDEEGGGLFLTAADSQALLVRPREHYDGALPSGNSVAADVLQRLARLTGDEAFEEASEAILSSFGPLLDGNASAHTRALHATDFRVGDSFEVVIAVPGDSRDAQPFLAALNRVYLPRVVVHVVTPETQVALSQLAPYLAHQPPQGGRPTAYVCRQFSCQRPVHDPNGMLRLLGMGK